MKLAVVVPTWSGSAEWLPECLEALDRQTVHAQIVVVIDGVADDIEAMVRRTLSGARVIRRRERGGFAVAASAGLRACSADLIALLNDDAVPDPDWLAALRDGAARHPDAGSFASRVVRRDDPSVLDSAGHGLTRWGEPFAIGNGAPAGAPYDEEREVFGAPAAASAYRFELIRDCGVFDPNMGAYLEDVDLSLRAQLMGFPCVYLPTARVQHRGSASYGNQSSHRVAHNRWRLMARSMPRNLIRAGAVAAVLSAFAEGLRHPETLPALAAGLRDSRAALGDRGGTLGARRVSDDALRQVLRGSEADLLRLCSSGGPARRARGLLARTLAASVDARERSLGKRGF
jgi:GT2 family glycosyltransferase